MSAAARLDRDAISRAAQRHGVSELSVFRSAGSGDSHATSDVDFLVDFLPGRTDPLQDFCGLREDLERIVERDIDIVVKRTIRRPYFRESALAHAETIYVAGSEEGDLHELDHIVSRSSRAELLERIVRRGVVDLPPAEEVLAQARTTR